MGSPTVVQAVDGTGEFPVIGVAADTGKLLLLLLLVLLLVVFVLLLLLLLLFVLLLFCGGEFTELSPVSAGQEKAVAAAFCKKKERKF